MAYLGLSPGRAEGVQDDPHSPPLFEELALGAFCKRDCAFEDDRLDSSAILEHSNWIEKKAPLESGAESESLSRSNRVVSKECSTTSGV